MKGEEALRKVLIMFSSIFILLAGCSMKNEEIMMKETGKSSPSLDDTHKIENKVKTLSADSSTFHFVADWLSNTEIVFVEKDDSVYYVKTFNTTTGAVTTLYEESAIIVDVLIHPSKNALLLHTTDSTSSAVIKIVALDGILLNEVSIASSELAIEWNDIDETLVLLTAFQQDWTFDVALYNGKEDDLQFIPLEDPFPKWLGAEKIVTVDATERSLDGEELITYNVLTEEYERSGVIGAVHFDTYKDTLLTVQLSEETKANYTILTEDGKVLSTWTMPGVSNDSEWAFPEINWVSSETVIIASTESEGQLNGLEKPFKLFRITDGVQEPVAEEVLTSSLRCSPDGIICLTGYGYENLIDTKSKEEITWLVFPE